MQKKPTRPFTEGENMKKQIAILVAAGAVLCAFCGCEKGGDPDEYDILNTILGANYSKIELTVKDEFEENVSLESTYTISYSSSGITVSYSVERFSQASLDDPDTGAVKTLTGTAVIQNGTVTSVTGDDIGLTADIAKPSLTFKSSYFKNALFTSEFLVADVADPVGFLGTSISCSNMKIAATYGKVFKSIDITYTSAGGSNVEYVYTFTF